MRIRVSIKHFQIDKANNLMLLIIAISSIVTVFSLMGAKALLSQSAYQRKVLAEKNKAVRQLKDNISSVDRLVSQYEVFQKANPNIIGGRGGSNPGTGPSDGDNSQIVLDALPSQYDFPALLSSLEKIITSNRLTVQGISSIDQSQDPSFINSGAATKAIPMSFSLNVSSDYGGVQSLIRDLERSIRPIDIISLTLSGNASSLNITIDGLTYYLPSSGLKIEQKEIR